MSEKITHPIEAVYDENSRILILGSFPSVKSREYGFFYGHPQNRFWLVVAAVCGDEVPCTNDEKRAFLLRHKIALWDVIDSCEITGSADSTIKNAVPTDIRGILAKSDITQIFTNGKKADELYQKFQEPATGMKAICLPSTSPANAAWHLDKLCDKWRSEIQVYL